MTNSQKWVAAFLVVFVVLFALQKLTENEDLEFEETEFYNPETQTAEEVDVDGSQLIKNFGCLSCHGQDMNGTNLAPALVGLSDYWSRDGLINYLRNPSSYSGDDRFEEYKKTFKGIVMPSYSNKDVKELGKIADYLMSLDKD